MNKMKRILALTICLLLAITSLPVMQLFANADEFVSYQETTFNNVDEISWKPLSTSPFLLDYATPSIDEDGYYTLTQTATSGDGDNKLVYGVRDLNKNLVAKDDDNRTEVMADAFNGKFKIELDVDVYVKKYETKSAGYVAVHFSNDKTDILLTRFRDTYLDIADNSTAAKGVYVRGTTALPGATYSADKEPQSVSMKYEIDTVNGTVTSWYNDILMSYKSGKFESEEENVPMQNKQPFNKIRFFETSRIDNGSYVKFKNLKITQIEDAAKDKVASLPAKLVDNVNGATETTVTLKNIDGVTWASADTSAATVNGNTLTLIPSTEGEKEATVTATFAHSGVNYVKTYKMTLAKAEEVVTPDPEPDPDPTPNPEPADEGVVAFDKTFNYADVDAAYADGWTVGTVKNANFVIEDGFPTLKQFEKTVIINNTTAASDPGTTITYTFPAGAVAEDVENGTKIITEDGKYTGVVKIDVDAQYEGANAAQYTYTHNYVDDNKNPQTSTIKVSESFHSMNFAGNQTAIQWRVRPSGVTPLSNSNQTGNGFKTDIVTPKGGLGLGGKPADGVSMSATIDTTAQTVSATLGETGNGLVGTGSTWSKNQSKPSNVTYLDKIVQFQMIRLDVDAYSKVKSLKVTTLDPKFGTETANVLDKLPAKLVGDINGATELTVDLPAISGVTWTSLNEDAATVSGNKLSLIPSKTETKAAVVKANFTTDGIKYSKEYTFTVAVNDSLFVEYYVDGAVYSTVGVKKNDKATSISAPAKVGMVFDGWYLDGSDTAFDFETAITADTKLYAKYSVDPDYNPAVDGVVSFSKNFNYADVNAAYADGWTVTEENHAKFVIENGVPTLSQIKQTVTENNEKATASFGTEMKFRFPAGPVAADLENRTSIINLDGKYTGKVKVDVDTQLDVGPATPYTYNHTYKDGDKDKTVKITVNPSYGTLEIIGNKNAVNWRIRASDARAMSHTNEGDNDIKDETGNVILGGIPINGFIASSTIDTVAETVSATVPYTGNGSVANGTTWAKYSNKADLTYISSIEHSHMIRIPVGGYSKIKGVTVTTMDPQFGTTTAILGKLPAKLDVDDVNAVKTAEFTLPTVDGVKWTTSDSSLLSIDGNKVTVNRVKGEAKEVVVTATFKADDINFAKEYSMTLAAGENIIKYYDVNGDLFDVKEVKDGEKASEITAPAVEHYNFIGWYTADANTAFDFGTAINNHVTLYAKYEPKTYNVIFKADGNTVATLTGKYNSYVEGTIPSIPPKSGSTAIGWYIENTEVPFGEATLISGPDMVINAKYAEGFLKTYKVTFKVDGSVYAQEDAFDGYAVALPENPVKDNYVFDCWTLDGEDFDAETPITSNITLVAKFSPLPVKVTFYMDETMSELFVEGTGYYNTAYGKLSVPSKNSYKFLGWKTVDGTDFTKDTIVTEEISVYATWEYAVKVILDEDITSYYSTTGNNVQFVDDPNASISSYFDGGYVTQFVKSDPTDRAFSNFIIGKIRAPEADYSDESARRVLYNSKFVGDYAVEVTFDAKLSGKYVAADGTNVNAPYGYYSTGNHTSGTAFNAIMVNRLYNTFIGSYNSTSVATNSFNALETNKTGASTSYTFKTANGIVADNTISMRYNTVDAIGYMDVNDSGNVAFGTPNAKVGYVNGFQFKLMGCNQVGDYIKIKRVRVIKYDDYSNSSDFEKIQEVFDKLPKTLVADPYDAKGTVDLPSIKGVTWSSSDESIVSTKTGEITPWYDDAEVEVTATITSGMYAYEMVYTLTVKGSVTEPEEIVNETFTTEEDLSNWEFVNLDEIAIGDYAIDENGVKVSKITPAEDPEKGYEMKRYFAFYDLYSTVENDAYSITEVKDHEGVYDITVDYAKASNSEIPMNIAVGYRNGNTFYDFGVLKVNKKGTRFAYQETGETKAYVDLSFGDSATVTFRVDTIRNEICLFSDGKIVGERYAFKTTLGENVRINSVKVELDTNNEFGDYVTVKSIRAEKVMGTVSDALNAVLSAAKTFDISDITANPDSVSGNIKKLPSKIGGYDVVWKASSNQIDLESGEVFHAPTANKVYLYAEIYDADSAYPYVVRKTFELNVRAAANGTESDKYLINSLGRVTNQPYGDIRYDLDLPQLAGITWTSSNTAIIANDGILNKNAVVTSATPVTITATSNGVSKEYKLVVSPRTATETVASGETNVAINLNNIENAKVSGDVVANFTYTKGAVGNLSVVDPEGRALVSLVADAEGFHFDYIGSDYAKYTLDSAEISIVAMPDVKKGAIYVNGDLVADYVPFKFATDYIAGVVSEINVGTIKLSMDKYDILQSNLDNFDYFTDVKYEYANASGIKLATNVFTNAVVTWTSADTSILSNKGVVTTPNAMTIVPVEFKITDSQNSNVYISKKFDVAVDCDNSRNIVYNVIPEVEFKDPSYPQSNLTDAKVNTIFKAIDTNVGDFEIVLKLGETKSFNSVFVLLDETNMGGFKVYSSNDGASWQLLTSGTMDGEYSKLVRFSSVSASHIKFVVDKTDATEVGIKELKLYLNGTPKELAEFDLELLTIDSAATGSSINLPKKGVNGTVFTWVSSNTDVISNDGEITRPSSGTTVVMTAKVVVDGEELSKSFDVYVDSKSTSGPTQVGGGSGGGGGAGGGASSGAASKPVIGGTTDDTVYTETEKEETPVVPSTTSKYNDVKSTDWYYDAVMTLTEKGVVSGDGSGEFKPNDNVTREQFVKMILEAIDVEVKAGNNDFEDVVAGAWYSDYIATAVSNGIVNGIGDGKFGVGTNISRQDMAVLIERVLKFKEIEIEKEETTPFADEANVADYAKEAVANMKAIGLIKGYENKYNPKDNLTRAEAATVITTLLELLAK